MKLFTVLANNTAFEIEIGLVSEVVSAPDGDHEFIYVGNPESRHFRRFEILDEDLISETEEDSGVYILEEAFLDLSDKNRHRHGVFVPDKNPNPIGILVKIVAWDDSNPNSNIRVPVLTLIGSAKINAEGMSNATNNPGGSETKRLLPEYLVYLPMSSGFTIVHPVTGVTHRFLSNEDSFGLMELTGKESLETSPEKKKKVGPRGTRKSLVNQ